MLPQYLEKTVLRDGTWKDKTKVGNHTSHFWSMLWISGGSDQKRKGGGPKDLRL